MLQTLCKLAQQMKTLYVTGEESLQQVAMRAHRLGLPTDNLNMLSETSIEQICLIAEEEQPKLMVIDSIGDAYGGCTVIAWQRGAGA